MNIAIILAAGMGKRMKAGKNKVFLTIDRKPIIWHTVNIFEKNDEIDKILIVAKKDELLTFEKMKQGYRWNKVTKVIAGGKERQDSACAGLRYVRKNFSFSGNDLVLFHNGANPFVENSEISAVIKSAVRIGASAVAHPTKDTIKVVNEENLIEKTLDRSKLWNMQTPQAIKIPLAIEAFESAKKESFTGTDDVSLVERLGKKATVVLGSENNFKITTPVDLELAKIIFKQNKNV